MSEYDVTEAPGVTLSSSLIVPGPGKDGIVKGSGRGGGSKDLSGCVLRTYRKRGLREISV